MSLSQPDADRPLIFHDARTATLRMLPSLLVACAGVATLLPTPPETAFAAQTIIGTWAPDPAACTPVGGMISIGPMSLTGDERQCEFHDVARRGDVVTWRGSCSDGTARTPATVVAALHRGTLAVAINDQPSGTYRRCNPR